jgi:hypothetical protein
MMSTIVQAEVFLLRKLGGSRKAASSLCSFQNNCLKLVELRGNKLAVAFHTT